MTLETETLLSALAGVTADMDDQAKQAFRAELRRVLPPVIQAAGTAARLQAATVKPKMSAKEADRVINDAVEVIMRRDGVTYDRAFMTLAKEKPALVEGWQTIRNRERREKQR